jgi:hypothetical protein
VQQSAVLASSEWDWWQPCRLIDVDLWGNVGERKESCRGEKRRDKHIPSFNPRKTNLTSPLKMERNSPPKRRAAKACAFCRRRKASRLRCFKCHGLMLGSSAATTNDRYVPTARHTRKNVPIYQDPTGPGTPLTITYTPYYYVSLSV